MRLPGPLRWIILGLLIVCLLLIGLSLLDLRTRIANLDLGQQTGPIWFVTGIESDLLQLEKALLAYSLGTTPADNVNQRFDILWSRVATSLEGANAQKLRDFGVDAAVLSELFEELKASDQTIVGLEDQDNQDASVLPFLERLSEYNAPIRSLSLDVLRTSSEQSLGWRRDLVFASGQVSVLIGVTFASFLIMLAIFFLESMNAKNLLKEKEKLLESAEAANQAKAQFISVMNHELRTPMTSIHGSLRMLGSGVVGDFNEKQRQLLDMAERNSAHLSSLIEDVLDFQRFSDGRISMSLEKRDISETLGNEASDYAAICDAHGVSFALTKTSEAAICLVDEKRLKQVLLNLINNAAKFSAAGGQVDLTLTLEDDSARIEIADSGAGIPSEHHEKLFRPFYQVDSSDSRNKGGTGLGLSISKSIIESFDGSIWFESALTKGTTFYILLPIATDA